MYECRLGSFRLTSSYCVQRPIRFLANGGQVRGWLEEPVLEVSLETKRMVGGPSPPCLAIGLKMYRRQ